MRKINIPTGARVVMTAASCIVVYEGVAYVMNKSFGLGLPYTPAQITPCNAESAAIFAAGIASTAIFNSLMWRS